MNPNTSLTPGPLADSHREPVPTPSSDSPNASSPVPLSVLQQVLEGLRALPDTPPSEQSEKSEKTGKSSGMRGEVWGQ